MEARLAVSFVYVEYLCINVVSCIGNSHSYKIILYLCEVSTVYVLTTGVRSFLFYKGNSHKCHDKLFFLGHRQV